MAMKRKHKRLVLFAGALVVLGAAAALILSAIGDSLVFFYSPTELQTKVLPAGQLVRIGGLVEAGSVKHSDDGGSVSFRVTDLKQAVAVSYTGLLPDLFREGQGVVVQGKLGPDGVFQAREVLAKHDEKYMPREVADALKKSGEWRPEAQ
jgi:cytochrome c-type biogenesis protein CcmE